MSSINHNFKTLSREIISLSDAKEWQLTGVYFVDKPQTCLCSHYPILKCCELTKMENKY